MMDNIFSSSVAAGLAAASEVVGDRMDSPVSFAITDPLIIGPDAVARFTDGTILAWTRLAGDPGIHVGLVFEDEALFTLAALKLRLGVFPEEMTEEVEQTLNELVASFITAWNGAQRLPRMGWDELAPVRSVAVDGRAALDAQLGERPVGMVGATLTLGSSVFSLGIVGSLGWMPAATRVVEPAPASRPSHLGAERTAAAVDRTDTPVAAPAGPEAHAVEDPPPATAQAPAPPGAPDPPSSRGHGDESLGVAFPTPPPPPFDLPAASAPRPEAERPGGARSEGGTARVMIVDASGALSAWLSRQLASRTVALYHADAAALAASEGATVLIVDADAALFAQFEPERMVVMRRG